MLAELLGDEDGVSVIAIGGYGRRELCPFSDLDVLLVHKRRRDIAEVAQRLWYPIWDAGVGLDHSVRTSDEVLAVAASDLRTMLGLLDGRFVAGSDDLAQSVLSRAHEQWQRNAKKWMPVLSRSVTERHERFGDVAFLLEPELKESKGGLRDLGALAAIADGVPVVDRDQPGLSLARNLLLTVRVELHRSTGRVLDRLLLERQDDVAARLSYGDADLLMADVASVARGVAWTLDDTMRRVDAWVKGPPRRGAQAGDRPVDRGIVLRDGEIELSADADVAHDPSLPLRVGAAAAYVGAPIARRALERLVDTPPPGEPWSDDTRNALLSLLGGGDAMIGVVEALDHYGIVARIIPEWDAVRSKPQRNAFHRFTVDRHLLEAVAQAARLTRTVARPDLLLIGALLHDIGKGYPGDHTDEGVVLARKIAGRMGFSPDDVDVIVTLVREHLLLPKVATGRDLADPATISFVSSAVGTVEVLELLAALSEADSIATGETAWSKWKEQLLRELTMRVESALTGTEPAKAIARNESDHLDVVERAGDGVAAQEQEDGRLVVVAPDRPGLLSRIVGLLTLHGQSVRSAQVRTSDTGAAVDEFELEPVFDKAPEWDRFEEELREVLDDRRQLDGAIASRARRYERRPTAARPAEPRVWVHDGASEDSTVIEVRAADTVGLLYRITTAISRLELDIRHAKVATLGHEVVDTFYLQNQAGEKLTPGEGERVRAAVLVECGAPADATPSGGEARPVRR